MLIGGLLNPRFSNNHLIFIMEIGPTGSRGGVKKDQKIDSSGV